MKRMMVLVAVGAALTVAACEEPVSQQVETAPPPMAEPVAPAATDEGVPAADTTAPNDSGPVEQLPPDQRSSSQSVQPESETLFY